MSGAETRLTFPEDVVWPRGVWGLDPTGGLDREERVAAVEINEAGWKRINDAIAEATGKAFTEADPGTDLHKLGVALSLLALLDTEILGKQENQTLAQYDPEARDVLALRKALLEQKRDQWFESKTVTDALLDARQKGVEAALGADWLTQLENHGEWLGSAEFLNALERMSEKDRSDRLKAEALKVGALSPEIAQDVAVMWLAWELQKRPLHLIRSIPQAEAEKALEDLLELLEKMSRSEASIKSATGPAGTEGATLIAGHAIQDLLATAVSRRAIARGMTNVMRTRGYYGSLDQGDGRLIARLKADNVPGAELLERITKAGFVGRGVTTFFSLWGLSAVSAAFPPRDESGNIRWNQLAVSGSTGLAIASNIPDMAKFLTDDVGPFLKNTLLGEYGRRAMQRMGNVAPRIVGKSGGMLRAAQAAKFAKVCQVLGVVGDAIALPLAIIAVRDEFRNEDAVGQVTSVIGALSAAGGLVGGGLMLWATFIGTSAATGVGLPLAVGAMIVGIAVAIIDAFFGESALTGQIRQDLRYLDISTEEESTTRDLTTATRTRTMHGYGYGYGYGGHTYQQRYRVSNAQIRARARSADKFEKIRLLNQHLEGWTDGGDETLIYDVLRDTPIAGNQFLDLIEGVDARRIASELERSGQASKIMARTAQAYHAAGRAPGPAFNAQLLYHAEEHRDETLNAFYDLLKDSGASGDQLNRAVYQKVEPSVLKQVTKSLMAGDTNNGEERAIYRTLGKTSWTQFGAVIGGDEDYVEDLKDELERDQWADVRRWMADPKAGSQANSLARKFR